MVFDFAGKNARTALPAALGPSGSHLLLHLVKYGRLYDGIVVTIGALGVISVWSNVAPFDVHQLCQSFFDGDLETARRIQRKGLALIDALFSEVSPIPVKKAMNLMGKNVGPLRAPLCEMSEAGTKKLAEALKAYGIL